VAELFRRYADDGASIADLARWLTDQGMPTRTGKTRWDRSVIWGMLRNPAYAGRAVFGKTMVINESPGLNRRARIEGRDTPRATKTVDRPSEDWVHIPVPAIVDQDTFDRVAARLADNKRFASRNSKTPSLLQGLAACASCGYGYYRASARTTNKTIYYYRCLGSDDYRHESGRVCHNKPVRADYLDQLVWDHITGLLADPRLIRTEIDKRLHAARTADPANRQRESLQLALAKATTAITRMIEAFQEQLVTIDELRTRMPDLRARETNLRNQISALDAQHADRERYLTLATTVEAFLAQLHNRADTADDEQRQRVLRLVVKDVLVGPDNITIRHRIPVHQPASNRTHEPSTTNTEGDHRAGYPLCWGRNHTALRSSLLGRREPLARLEHPGFEPVPDHPPRGEGPERGEQPAVVDPVERRGQVRVQRPHALGPGALARHVDRLDRVLAAAAWPEPVRSGLEPGLPLGLQRVADPALVAAIRDHGNPQRAPLRAVARLRYVHPLDRAGLPGVGLGVHAHRQLHPGRGGQRDLPVDPRRLAAGVALRGLPHADQRVRPTPQHKLLQVPDLGQVPFLTRLEDPLP
jgi:site-specific DNA recombinase